jgi:hypothetical protein
VRTLLEPDNPDIAAGHDAAEPRPVSAGTCLTCAAILHEILSTYLKQDKKSDTTSPICFLGSHKIVIIAERKTVKFLAI